jgi:hypothetical protein
MQIVQIDSILGLEEARVTSQPAWDKCRRDVVRNVAEFQRSQGGRSRPELV